MIIATGIMMMMMMMVWWQHQALSLYDKGSDSKSPWDLGGIDKANGNQTWLASRLRWPRCSPREVGWIVLGEGGPGH